MDRYREQLSRANARFTYQLFPGFLRALEACYVPWNKVKFSDSVGFRSNENCHNFQKVRFNYIFSCFIDYLNCLFSDAIPYNL